MTRRTEWPSSFGGFYLTRGHYSNNSSGTLPGYFYFPSCATKRGPTHNWEGTSGGSEGDMFEEAMAKVKDAGFVVHEIITDKDSAMNAMYFPEGTFTYCANHCAKTLTESESFQVRGNPSCI